MRPPLGSRWRDLRYPDAAPVTVRGIVAPEPDNPEFPAGAGKAFVRSDGDDCLRLVSLSQFDENGDLTPCPGAAA